MEKEKEIERIQKYLSDLKGKPQIVNPKDIFKPCPLYLLEAYYYARAGYDNLVAQCLDLASSHFHGNTAMFVTKTAGPRKIRPTYEAHPGLGPEKRNGLSSISDEDRSGYGS